jgi:hypothetical protein
MPRTRAAKTLIPVDSGISELELQKRKLSETLSRYSKKDMDKQDFVFFLKDIKEALTIVAQINNLPTSYS